MTKRGIVAVIGALGGCVAVALAGACASTFTDKSNADAGDASDAQATDSAFGADASGAADPCAHVLPPPAPATDDDPSAIVPPIVLAIRETALTGRLGFDAGALPGVTPLTTFGFDLDHACTCQLGLQDGGGSCVSSKAACDGDGGIDDSVGVTINELAGGFSMGVSNATDVAINAGDLTMLFTISNYNGKANDRDVPIALDVGTRPDGPAAPGCNGGTRPATDAGGYAPAWDGCDRWGHYGPEVVLIGYVTNHRLVGTSVGSIPMLLARDVVSVQGAVLEGVLVPTADGSFSLEDATMSARVPGGEFVHALGTSPAGAQGTPACFTQTFTTLVQSAGCGARDIMSSASQDFGGLACDALSTTIALRAEPAFRGDVKPFPIDPCADAGADLTCPK